MLTDALSNRDARARRAAVMTLGRLREDAVDAIPQIAGMVDDADEAVGNAAAGVLVNNFGELAVPAVAALVGQTTVVERRRTILVNNVLVPIGARALPALNFYVAINPGARVSFNPVFNRYSNYVPPVVVAPTGAAAGYYRDLTNRLRQWENKEQFLDHALLAKELKMSDREFKAFLKRLDRDGDGKISRHEYEHWAHDHAKQFAKAEEARKVLHEANERLRQNAEAERKKALHDAQAKLQSINSEKAKHPDARKLVEDRLKAQQKKAQNLNASAHKAMLAKQRELNKAQRHQSPVARQLVPHKPAAPRPAANRKPPDRRPVVHHGGGRPAPHAPPGGGGHAPKGGGGKKHK